MTESGRLENLILNSPYDPPARHFVLSSTGPTGETAIGRRPSASFIPVPVGRQRRGVGAKSNPPDVEQGTLDYDVTGSRREPNSLINDIRVRVDRWRAYGYPGVTPVSRKLLQHWADPKREDRMLFCQREAAETAIYLAEVAGRRGETDFRPRIDDENRLHNNGLPRLGLKMATGTGKTVVMAMLIAWHTANKAFGPRDARFTNRFLVVTPGITIRDRLRVLLPSDAQNYYRERDLVPPDLWPTLADASISITNYHTFLLRDAKEIRGVAANTRKLLNAGKSYDPFKETDPQMVERIVRDLTGRGRGEIVVLNDEAHHCYQDRPLSADDTPLDAATRAEAKERNEGARVWFRGISALSRSVGVKTVYDLSATPFYLGGSGYLEGFIFPWVVSDFSLMDAIESGIVKVPRVPTDDDAAGEQPTYRNLWEHVGTALPKRAGRKAASDQDWVPPKELQGALESLYRSYQRRYRDWEDTLEADGEPPPVFIVVCPNTIVSKLVYDWIAGQNVETADGHDAVRPGRLPLLSNVEDGQWLARPRTILIDSAQLESGESMKQDFKDAAAREIEVFKAEYRRRDPSADVDKLTDEDLLREVMNTVGKRGRLGERVRAVVSVSMLTEGWDANTVSHILGIRRFGSQLLCEQVVGRGLRRRSYAPNDSGRFEPEYAEVYGVPFEFLPGERSIAPALPSRPAVEVRALEDRLDLRITFPKVEAYRVEPGEERIAFDAAEAEPLRIDRELVATWTETGGLVGKVERQELESVRGARPQQVAYSLAADVLRRHFAGHDGATKPWLFPALVDLARQWLDPTTGRVSFAPDTPIGALLLAEPSAQAAQALFNSIVRYPSIRSEKLLPMLRRYDGSGSTDDVSFVTRKAVIPTTRSPVSHVVLDGAKGNTWEETLAGLLEDDTEHVASYVKNDHLGFTIPYLWKGRSHEYWPDFLVRLVDQPEDELAPRTLIVEVSGGRKDQETAKAKATTARDHWCTAVNNLGTFGRWGYVEIDSMLGAADALADAIRLLYVDAPIIGDPERLEHTSRGAL